MTKHTPGPYTLVVTRKNADGSPHEMEIRSRAVSRNYDAWLKEQGKEKAHGDWGTVTMGKYHQMINGSGPQAGPETLLSDEEAFANAQYVHTCLSAHDDLVALLREIERAASAQNCAGFEEPLRLAVCKIGITFQCLGIKP
jgi:hypothetical protein